MRTRSEVEIALRLAADGHTATEVARVTGIPRETVRDWIYGRCQRVARQGDPPAGCGVEHDFEGIHPCAYSYLLGLYLGDGCISRSERSVRLRITLDSAYPLIVDECARTIPTVVPDKRVYLMERRDSRCIEVSAYWKHWPCLFPQHGPGRKHERRIELAEWQQMIVDARPEPFIRRLIHSDGCRIIATERKGSYVRRAARYAFTNNSEDILQLFANACDRIGVHHTRASWKQIAIYSKDSVARLDEFIGPKR